MKKLIFIFLLATTNVFCQNIISNSWYKNDSVVVAGDSAQQVKISTYNLSLDLQESLVLRGILNAMDYAKLSVEEKRCLNSLNTYIEAFISKPTTKVNVNLFVPKTVLPNFISQYSRYSQREFDAKKKELTEYQTKLISKQNLFKQIKEFEERKGVEKTVLTESLTF